MVLVLCKSNLNVRMHKIDVRCFWFLLYSWESGKWPYVKVRSEECVENTEVG